MRTMRIFLCFLLVLLMLQGCGKAAETPDRTEPEPRSSEQTAPPITEHVKECTLHVEPVENLPDPFFLGMDASCVPALERSGVTYYNYDGEPQDVYRTLAESGVNLIRVRVWNDPYDGSGHGYGGGNCDLENALEIGRRATKNGMPLLVDFHYSDFWADPGKQMAPKAWSGYSVDQKAEALKEYTRESLLTLREAGVAVAMVQVGNETNGAMCGEKEWKNVVRLMQAGSEAVREVYPEALVAVHFANPESGAYPEYARNLDLYGLDYDVFGSSYYPYWHGTLDNLTTVLSRVRRDYNKEVMVMETSYAWTEADSDFSGNTIPGNAYATKPYPYTLQGQVNSLRDVTAAAADAGGIGVCYWEGTWITVGGASREENSRLWETCGSGWASSYAAEYDPEDAGKWYGGCAVDNQAFFDPEGRPLESLLCFALLREGNEGIAAVDDIRDCELTAAVGETPELPAAVTAVMTDGTTAEIPVTWEIDAAALASLCEQAGTFTLEGTADGRPVRLQLNVLARNYLQNPGFEDGQDAPWIAENLGGGEQLNIEKKSADSKTGDWHYHFWSPTANTVEFTLEQEVSGLPAGVYHYEISIMGGDCGETEIYAYVKLEGETLRSSPMRITSYGEWDTGTIDQISVEEGQTLIVGIYVSAARAGAWGKIDDAALLIAE